MACEIRVFWTQLDVHEALARVRRRSRVRPLSSDMDEGEISVNRGSTAFDPEQMTSNAEVVRILEEANALAQAVSDGIDDARRRRT